MDTIKCFCYRKSEGLIESRVDTDSPSIALFGLTTHLRKHQQKAVLKEIGVINFFFYMVQGKLKIVWLKLCV